MWSYLQLSLLLLLPLLCAASAITALCIYIYVCNRTSNSNSNSPKKNDNGAHILIVLGSGGHTAEMLLMLEKTPLHRNPYAHRTYVVSSGDAFSAQKAADFERALRDRTTRSNKREGEGSSPLREISPQAEQSDSLAEKNIFKDTDTSMLSAEQQPASPAYTIITVPRARKVHQSLLTAPFTTLLCFWSCLLVLLNKHPDTTTHQRATWSSPDIILANGPATAVCMVLAAKLVRAVKCLTSPLQSHASSSSRDKHYPRIIFIESWARVKTLSLSGKIVLPFADRFLVQWKGLKRRKTEYIGVLV